MIAIEIAHQIISLDLVCENEFTTLKKYETNKSPEFFIKTYIKGFDIPLSDNKISTEYYDIYKMEDKTIQIQKQEDKKVGAIVYEGKTISIYLKKPDFILEYLLTQYAFVYIIRSIKKALFMHGSSLKYKDMGIIFSAKSGTGKSTHSRLWQKYSNSVVINDDKNVILYENDKLVLYPNPWSGKHQIDNKVYAPLECIVFLYQNKENIVKKLKPLEAIRLLLGQVELPREDNKHDWNFMIDRILELPIYYYGCNMEKEAFDILCERLENDLCK